MKTTILGIIAGLFLLLITSFLLISPEENYGESWKQVEQYVKQGLPKSALKVVEQLYDKAKAEGNDVQSVKCLIYMVSLESRYEEASLKKAITRYETALVTAPKVEKAVLQSLLAELYQQYYASNRWAIYDRTNIANDQNDDLDTWDAARLERTISSNYLGALTEKTALQHIALDDFQEILVDRDTSDFSRWPGLYDLLANRAINYFTTTTDGLTQMDFSFSLKDTLLFAPAATFVQLDLSAFDQSIPYVQALSLYQHLLSYHLAQGNTRALVDLDLNRLNFVHNKWPSVPGADDPYISALRSLSKAYKNKAVFVPISLRLAEAILGQSPTIQLDAGDSRHSSKKEALEVYETALQAFPESPYAAACSNAINTIRQPSFDFSMATANLPENPFLSLVQFRNTERLFFKIIQTDPDQWAEKRNMGRSNEALFQLLQGSAVASWSQDLPKTSDYEMHSLEVKIPALSKGFFVVVASDDPEFSKNSNLKYHTIWVTSMSYLSKDNNQQGSAEIYVLDRESGDQLAEVTLEIYKYAYDRQSRSREYDFMGSYQTDAYGYVALEQFDQAATGRFLIKFTKGDDRFYSEDYMNFYRQEGNRNTYTKTYFFTDRAIYRPGQTVYFKGIMVDQSTQSVAIKTKTESTVAFRDANHKEIMKQEVVSNDFGSFTGSFVIPSASLNGQMTIMNETGRLTFQVEAYKRPGFQIVFDPIDTKYKIGEEVVLSGKAEDFAGSAVSNASVRYRVTRMASRPVPYYRGHYIPWPLLNKEVEIEHGVILTKEDGRFQLSFAATALEGLSMEGSPVYTYTVYADVTDISGEVQSAQTRVYVGATAVLLSVESAEKVNKLAKDPISLKATNYAGTPVAVNTLIRVYQLIPPDRLMVERDWEQPDLYQLTKADYENDFIHHPYKEEMDRHSWPKKEILSATRSFTGSTTLFGETIKDWKVGYYLLTVETVEESGEPVKVEQYFSLFTPEGKKMPEYDIYFAALTAATAEPGESVQLVLGSMAKKSRILVEISSGSQLLERNWISLNRGQKIINIPILESHRGNLSIHTSMVRFNRIYGDQFVVNVPYSNKELELSVESFRDHLTPGSEETWTVTIKGPKGEKLAAELLAGMYDASLDQFAENSWNLSLYHPKNNTSSFSPHQFGSRSAQILHSKSVPAIPVYLPDYPSIDWFGFNGMSHGRDLPYAVMDGIQLERADTDAEDQMDEVLVQDKNSEAVLPEVEESEPAEAAPAAPLRSNFSETAFFFPQLRTDADGQLAFSFKTPDALTEWKLMLLAHTRELEVGKAVKKIKASKELMVMPHVPRFVRQGDQLVFTAKVINFTDQPIDARVGIIFYDALTQQTIDIIATPHETSVPVSIRARQNMQLSWTLDIPDNVSMIGYRIKAESPTFSDGEERVFPVLTNRMLVTETMPMYVNARQQKTFAFERLIQTGKFMGLTSRRDYRYTLEFTANPAWYAIQALPALSMPKYESTDNLFRVYYTNQLAAYIVNSNPAIRQVLDSWQQFTPEAFYSNLEKNEELKAAVLQATPWVLEAQNEGEQKRRIALLFDLNRLSGDNGAVLGKLLKMQHSSGAWPWFRGGNDNPYVTQSLVLGLAKLHNKGVIDLQRDGSLMSMLRRAVAFLDKAITDDFERLKETQSRKLDSHHLSAAQIQYLYARSLLLKLIPVDPSAAAAFAYYESQTKRYWLKHSNYLQAMAAVSLYRLGHRNEAEAIIRSLRERALTDDEMGMYWRQETAWYWYQAGVETQAMIIEAFDVVQKDKKAVGQMKVWLLKQKQTNSWKTNTATAEAIFALLMTEDRLLDENQPLQISVAGKPLELAAKDEDQVEAGTGYFKTSWSAPNISGELGRVEVNNPNNNIAWGAAYWQYFEDLDKISAAQSPLYIEKQMFTEVLTDGGPLLTETEPGKVLKTGDKVVIRLIIKTDRDMEYVHLKDMRATAFEPVSSQSAYTYSGGLAYYKNTTDVSTDFFIQYLKKGTYVLEYPLNVSQKGKFSNGIATIQCLYAPEFAAHSKGVTVVVD